MAVSQSNKWNIGRERDKLGKFIKTIESKPYKIMLEEAARCKEEAKLETPVLTGKLKDSIDVRVMSEKGSKLSPTIRASAKAVSPKGYDYSNIQHENERFRHPRGGKAHYLRDPFNRMVERIDNRFSEEVRLD